MLTPKQEKFVQNLIKGMSQREAYKNSYDASKMKDKTIDDKASLLFKKDEIRARYEELIKKADDEAIMSAIERKKWLTDVIKGKTTERIVVEISKDKKGKTKKVEEDVPSKLKTRLIALDLLNKMDGQYTENLNLSGNVSHQQQKNAIDDIVAQMKPLNEDDV